MRLLASNRRTRQGESPALPIPISAKCTGLVTRAGGWQGGVRPGNLTVPAASKARTLDLLPSAAASLQAVEPARLRSRSGIAGLDLAPLTPHASCSCGCATWRSTNTWCLNPLQVGSLACLEQVGNPWHPFLPSNPPPRPAALSKKKTSPQGQAMWDGLPRSGNCWMPPELQRIKGKLIQSPRDGTVVPLHLGNLSFSAY